MHAGHYSPRTRSGGGGRKKRMLIAIARGRRQAGGLTEGPHGATGRTRVVYGLPKRKSRAMSLNQGVN